jgi:hypothetical protein
MLINWLYAGARFYSHGHKTIPTFPSSDLGRPQLNMSVAPADIETENLSGRDQEPYRHASPLD